MVVKLKNITHIVSDFPMERRLAKSLPINRAYKLIEVAKTAVRSDVENTKDEFSELYYHYAELSYPSKDNAKDAFSEEEALKLVLSLLHITE